MSIIASILGCLILIFKKITKDKLSPRCKFIIWVIFVIFLMLPVFISNKVTVEELTNISNFVEKDPYKKMEDLLNFNNKKNRFYIVLMVTNIFFLISVLTIIISSFLYWITNLLFYNEILEDERISQIVHKCKEKLGIKRRIKLIYQEFKQSPSIIGIFNVKILLSDSAFFLTDRELECVIMHELSHYKRKDAIFNIFINLVENIYLFNPILTKILKHIRMDIEVATDELAIRKMKNVTGREYCNVLIKMKNLCSDKRRYGLSLISKKSELSYRIDAIINKEISKKYNIFMFIFISIVIILMILIVYPIFHGKSEIPDLSLKLEDGTIIDMEKEDSIQLSNGSGISLIASNNKNIQSIFYEKTNVNEKNDYSGYIHLDRKIYYESGKYICNFTMNCKSGESVTYRLELLVE